MEVQFDEHKLLFVYAHDLEPFEEVLLQHGLSRDDTLKFISEAEHLHSTDDEYPRPVRGAALPARDRDGERRQVVGRLSRPASPGQHRGRGISEGASPSCHFGPIRTDTSRVGSEPALGAAGGLRSPYFKAPMNLSAFRSLRPR